MTVESSILWLACVNSEVNLYKEGENLRKQITKIQNTLSKLKRQIASLDLQHPERTEKKNNHYTLQIELDASISQLQVCRQLEEHIKNLRQSLGDD